jgi:hypothetical protein
MAISGLDHLQVLETAFADPKNTAIRVPPQDVNEIIANAYTIDRPHNYTLTEVWDMEVRKASQPDKYLGGVVRPGSLERFPSTRDDDEIEEFTRVGDQARWVDHEWSTVIEHVRIYKKEKRIVFIGASEFVTPDGRKIVAGDGQPLFHVEHSAAGTEERPINLWRIVLLTDGPDNRFIDIFDHIGKQPYLWMFHEIYLREDLGLKLERKPDVPLLE